VVWGRSPRSGISPPVFALFQELQHYVGFGEADERALRALHPSLTAEFPAISVLFYERVLEHPNARAALTRGESQVGHLKGKLVTWMNELFLGPWDEAYVERRARIGRVHVQIALPQHYMVSAMNVVRVELRDRIGRVLDERSPEGRAGRDAMERICDLDLALMLHTYREDLEASQARSERLSTFGALVGSIGHELRNPLGVIETSLYVLKGRPLADERMMKHLDRIGHQVTLANDIISQLLELIREQPVKHATIELGQLVGEALVGLHEGKVQFAPAPKILMQGDATQLRQVVVNLAQNASQFAGPDGQVEVKLERTGAAAVLTVDDSGPGIDPSIRNRLFEPLVTTRPGGIGLGLALVRRVVERHWGAVSASRSPLGGARFTVQLPLKGSGEPP
jgi:two-component system, NtrC family, sensor histidine kinase HydH